MLVKKECRPGLISVVMPCFNAERFIEQAVRSALGQSYGNVELIVVDDGSTDRSREILARLEAESAGRMTVLRQNNKGPYPARNLGLKHARGQFVAFLDADDFWDKDCLRKLRTALTTYGTDLAYCGWQNIGEGAPGGQPYVPPKYEAQDTVSLFLKSCPWPIHAALIRREVMEALGGFSERYFSSMDYDLWLRICSFTRNIILVPEVLAFYRWHNTGQISAAGWKQVLESLKVRRDFVRNNPSLVAHIPNKVLRQMTNGYLLESGYRAYWKRDLTSAHRLFRKTLTTGCWSLKDLKYLFPALLPEGAYRSLVLYAEAVKNATGRSR